MWTNCLNRLRKGMVTEDDKPILESRRLKNFPNKDMSDAELEEKLGEIQEEQAPPEPAQPQQPTFEGLRRLGTIT